MTVETFLRTLFGDLQGYLCLARISRLNGRGFSQTFFRYPEELEEALHFVHENDTYGIDLYLCTSLLSKPERKKEFCLSGYILWADLDECHPRNLGKFGEPKPNLILQTSEGRWQSYWILKDTLEPSKAEELNHRIALAYKDYGCDDGGWDLTQLMRLPTKNWKRVRDG